MSARSTTISCSGSATGKEKRRAFSGSRGTRNRGGRLPFPAGASTRSDGPERRSIPFGIGWRVDATTLTPPATSAPLAPGEENERNRSYGGDRCGPRQGGHVAHPDNAVGRSEEHTSELQSLMRSSYAVFCLKTKKIS